MKYENREFLKLVNDEFVKEMIEKGRLHCTVFSKNVIEINVKGLTTWQREQLRAALKKVGLKIEDQDEWEITR